MIRHHKQGVCIQHEVALFVGNSKGWTWSLRGVFLVVCWGGFVCLFSVFVFFFAPPVNIKEESAVGLG